jgi:hypothetical protein
MERAFQRLNQILHVVITKTGRQSQGPGMNNERLCHRFRGSHQPQAETVVYNGFQRSARTPEFPPQELRNIVVQGKCRAHIMMLADEAS